MLGGLLVLRFVAAWKMVFTSDEAQHLHVVWAWANRLLPYRDVFDNHTPLFHILCAPVFWLFGETAYVMIYMRWAMIPIAFAGLWFVFQIGERLFSRRVGWWAAVFAEFFPVWLVKGVEFRTDDMWATAWLAWVAVAVGRPVTLRRIFLFGLLLGVAFSVSMKTVLLAAALALAGLVALIFWWWGGGRWKARAVLRSLGAGLAGVLIVPGAIVAYFAAQHALFAAHDAPGTLYYGVIGHNLLPAAAHHTQSAFRSIWFPLAVPLSIALAAVIFRWAPTRSLAARRTLALLCAGFYAALLHSYWPMITGQDYLPIAPLLVLFVTPGILAVSDALPRRWAWWPRFALPLALMAVEIADSRETIRLRRESGNDLDRLSEVLHYTDPDDYVMDAKSGAIFRRRPFYYALEDVTMKRIELGLIKDDIVERLIATRTCVASDKRLQGRAMDFVKANYLHANGRYGIAGQNLKPDGEGRVHFEIQIVTTYTLVTPGGPAVGELDGKPFTGKALLAAGPHEFVSQQPTQPLVLVWSQAVERGYKPPFLPDHPKTKSD